MNSPRTLIHAAALADPTGFRAAPAAILLQNGRVLAAGSPQSIGEISGSDTPSNSITLRASLVIPALVNAHAHLDLTHIGPLPLAPNRTFADWANTVRARRALADDQIADSVRLGIALARAGGTAAIADIAGNRSLVPLQTLRESNLPGVSFLELFGLGQRQSAAIDALHRAVASVPRRHNSVALGLQPHAPYSAGLDLYRAAAALNLPLSTHLAESLDELAFVGSATGPLAQMIKSIGVWDDSITGSSLHPVDHLAPILSLAPCIAAHLNYLQPHHIPMLARWPITVAYCPRASAYFGHPHNDLPPHQYRNMLDAGINVALGTDSILCLDTPDRLSVLDDMRFLYRRDATNPITLLAMATVNGARALNLDPANFTFPRSPSAQGRPTAGLLAINIDSASTTDPLTQALLHNSSPRWLTP